MSQYNRLPTVTLRAHIARAIAFNKQTFYFGLGRTTPWDNENDVDFVPPAPSIESTDLDELIGMKRVTKQHLVYPDEEGDIVYRDRRWSIANTTEEAIEHGANYVYLETQIDYDELPIQPFRQIGLYSGVTIHPGVITDAVVPTHTENGNMIYGIDDPGILEVIDNRKVVNRASDSIDRLALILEI